MFYRSNTLILVKAGEDPGVLWWPLASRGFQSPLVLGGYFRLGSSKTFLLMKSPSPIIRNRLTLHRFGP